jgi:hypothetical protein
MQTIDELPKVRRTATWWYRRQAVVYFFGAGNAAIKIGVTTIFGDLPDHDLPNLEVKDGDLESFDLESFDPIAFQLEDDGLKNGVRRCLVQRHKQIQSSNHETITLLGVIPFLDGTLPARRAELCERRLHVRFAALRRFKPHTVGSEWFTREDTLVEFIERHTCQPKKFEIKDAEIGQPINR